MDVDSPEGGIRADLPGQFLQERSTFPHVLFRFRCSHTSRSRVHDRQHRSRSNCLQSSVLPADHVDLELIPRSLPPHVPQHQQKVIHVFLDHVHDLEDGMHECSVCLERYLGMTL